MYGILAVIISLPVINEVMANPAGPETGSGAPGDRNEFVEIYNPSDEPIDLADYFIADRMETDEIVPFPDSNIVELYPGVVVSTVIPPGGYGVILDREYLFEGNGQYPHPYSLPSGTVVMSTGDTDIGGNGISNSDSLWLIDAGSGDVVDVYPAPVDPPDGVSVERRTPDEGGWLLSREGCTPGRKNSVSVLVDIALSPGSFSIEPSFPMAGDEIILSCTVVNYGINDVEGFDIVMRAGGRELREHHGELLSSGDSIRVSLRAGTFSEGYDTTVVYVRCPDDEIATNDTVSLSFPVGISPLVINEINYSSDIEWVELYNRGDSPFSLSGIYIEDRSGRTSVPLPDGIVLSPDGYIVIASDSSFADRFPSVDFVAPKSFPSLNNSGDEVILKNHGGIKMDSVSYKPSWGGRDGRSLERVLPDVPGWEHYNWTECVDPSGSTPGHRNSVFMENRVPAGEMFHIRDDVVDVFSGGQLVLFYRSSDPVKEVRVMIFDEVGRLCSETSSEQPLREGQVSIDVSDLPQGLYIARISLTTVYGRTFRDKKLFSVKR